MKDNEIETLEKIIAETRAELKAEREQAYAYEDDYEHLSCLGCDISDEEWEEEYGPDYYEAYNAAQYSWSWVEQYELDLKEYEERLDALKKLK